MGKNKSDREAHERRDVSKHEKGNRNLKWHLEHRKNYAAGVLPKSMVVKTRRKSVETRF